MDTYHVVLYVHLLSLFVGVGAGAVLSVCLFRLKAATTLEEAVPFGALAGKTERAFPVAILGLFATGAYMTSDLWSWDTGWIVASIVGLALISLQGPLVGGRTGKMLERALHANGPGPLGDEAKRMTRHPGLWVTEFSNLCVVFGIVWNMTEKPGTAGAIAAIVVGYAVGAVAAMLLSRAGAETVEEAAAAQTTA
jgi:predicted integral membrane protein DUF2269